MKGEAEPERMGAGIRYIYFADQSGYGEAARAYLHGIRQSGTPLIRTPLMLLNQGWIPAPNPLRRPGRGRRCSDRDALLIAHGRTYQTVGHDTVILHLTPELWPRFINRDLNIIGMTVWETTVIPPHWAELLRLPHRLFVPSEFTRQVFLQNGVTVPISVIPHICRPVQREPAPGDIACFRRVYRIPENHYVFYTINEWTARKALWHTICAYLRAFTCRDPVVLIIKTSPRGPENEYSDMRISTDRLVHKIREQFTGPAKICCINQRLMPHEMRCLHQIGDCYVSLTHSEGWGLGAFDAATLGKPVIITGWGGHLDYLSDDTAFLVDYELIPVQDYLGRKSYRNDQQWAEPDLNMAVELFRDVYENPGRAAQKASPLPDMIKMRFNETVVTRQLLESLKN